MSATAPYSVQAYNVSWASENKIHDDTVAKRFGFTGGLVPGVEVFAYAAHPPVAQHGRAFLERGALEMRFLSPVYDGHTATVMSEPREDGGLDIVVESDGKRCATGHCAAPAGQARAVTLPAITPREPPAHETRPPAGEDTLAKGAVLFSRPLEITTDVSDTYLADVRETDPIYKREGIVHPGLLLRRCNAALVDNVVLPPWVHVGSRVEFVRAASVGERIRALSTVADNYERKGHRLVDLDAIVVGEGGRPIAKVWHTAIYRLRG